MSHAEDESGRKRSHEWRLILQWLIPQPSDVLRDVPHNRDAAFKKPSSKNLPSPEFLDYVYGAGGGGGGRKRAAKGYAM